MKKFAVNAFLAFSLLLSGCDKSEDPIPDGPDEPSIGGTEEPEPEPETPQIDAYNLSEDEMANCYIVQSAGRYIFKADNRFNLGEGLPIPPEIHVADAELLWQTNMDAIKSVEVVNILDEPYILFEVSQAEGNALIAALDSDGTVVWSWHIWMPEQEITSMASATGYEIMTMNLGAMNNTPGDAKSYGLLYQWGRKDPFPASATLTGNTQTVGAPLYGIDNTPVEITYSPWNNTDNNTIEYAISHPTVVLSNYSQFATSRDWLRAGESDDSLWGNPDGDYRDSDTNTFPNKGKKTCYDPSPAGWRVAPADAFRNLTTSGGYAWTFDDFAVADINYDGIVNIDDYNYGWHFLINTDSPLYFPATSRYDGSYAMLMGSMSGLWGNYWSNAPYSTIAGGAFCNLSFQVADMNGRETITVSPSGGSSRADAFAIRCVRDN